MSTTITVNGQEIETSKINGYMEILDTDSPTLVEMKQKANETVVQMHMQMEKEKEYLAERERIAKGFKTAKIVGKTEAPILDTIVHTLNHYPAVAQNLVPILREMTKKKAGRKANGETKQSENLTLEVINDFLDRRGEPDDKGRYKTGVGSLVDIFGIGYTNLVKIEDKSNYQEIKGRTDKFVDPDFLGRQYSHGYHSFKSSENQWETLAEYRARLEKKKIKGKKLSADRIQSLMEANLKKGESLESVK